MGPVFVYALQDGVRGQRPVVHSLQIYTKIYKVITP